VPHGAAQDDAIVLGIGAAERRPGPGVSSAPSSASSRTSTSPPAGTRRQTVRGLPCWVSCTSRHALGASPLGRHEHDVDVGWDEEGQPERGRSRAARPLCCLGLLVRLVVIGGRDDLTVGQIRVGVAEAVVRDAIGRLLPGTSRPRR